MVGVCDRAHLVNQFGLGPVRDAALAVFGQEHERFSLAEAEAVPEHGGDVERGVVPPLPAHGRRTPLQIQPRPVHDRHRSLGNLEFQLARLISGFVVPPPGITAGGSRQGNVRLCRNFSTALTE